jgi:hypothetical protein
MRYVESNPISDHQGALLDLGEVFRSIRLSMSPYYVQAKQLVISGLTNLSLSRDMTRDSYEVFLWYAPIRLANTFRVPA